MQERGIHIRKNQDFFGDWPDRNHLVTDHQLCRCDRRHKPALPGW